MVPTRATHPFWMFEELMATPAALDSALAPSTTEQAHRARLASRLAGARHVSLTGCGTAYHAALVGAAFLREATAGRVDAQAVQAFELAHYARPGPGAGDALIVLSHSGQPSATNAALTRAREAGAFTLTITGSPESQAARAADALLDTGYGEVKSFAYTISYSLMLAVLADLATWAGISATGGQPFDGQARQVAQMHRTALALSEPVRALAERWRARERWLFAGAGGNYATALEAALKMQETNYTASQGMEMEEVLHGPVAALGEAVLVVIAPPGAGRVRALDLLRAARLLGGETLALGQDGDDELERAATAFLPLPACVEALSPAPYHVPLHLLSYWLAVATGRNPDLMRRDDPRYLEARKAYML
ncbi:MAG: SIS domain-containing protein [Ktedonobacterales bacterium]|nr:SIS domain-containing protein [Ktedonobacterales bacterium]